MDDDSSIYSLIKGRFRSVKKKLYGIFFFIINQSSNSVDTASVIVSLYSSVYEINLKNTLSEFDANINKIKSEGQYALSITEVLQQALKSITENYDFYREVEPYIKTQNEEYLTPILQSFFGGILEDKKIDIEINIQEVDEDEICLAPIEDMDVSSSSDSDYKLDSEISTNNNNQSIVTEVMLEVDFLLAPVGGTSVNHLEVGDFIMVRIPPKTSISNHYINLLRLRDSKNHIIATPAEIISLKRNGNQHEVIVQIIEGVRGKIFEEEKILVKMADQIKRSKQFEQKIKKSFLPNYEEKKSSALLFVGLIIFSILLILFFILLAEGS